MPLHADDAAAEALPPRRLVLRALRLRCPRCGGGHLFRHWVQMVPRCPECGLPFSREEGSFLGAFVVNMAITFAALLGVFFWLIARQDARPGSSLLWPGVVGLGVCTVLPLACFPVSRTLWAAVELIAAPLELREILDASESVGHDDSSAA